MQTGELLAEAGGGFMDGDTAPSHNDWCDSLPVGHVEVCFEKSYKRRKLSFYDGESFLFPKLKESRFNWLKGPNQR